MSHRFAEMVFTDSVKAAQERYATRRQNERRETLGSPSDVLGAAEAEAEVIVARDSFPALVLDDGQVLTEVAAILQHLADPKPELGLAMPCGDLAHYRLLEWLTCISSEFHTTLGALFNPNLPPECREVSLAPFERRCDWLAGTLGEGPFLMGERYTIADRYLFTVLKRTSALAVDLGRVKDYMARVAARPAVQEALRVGMG